MKSGELHIIIIWSKALYLKDNIIEDLSEQFDILEVYEITWDKEYFTKNLSRFYGEKLPVPHLYKRWYSGNFYQRTSYKERQCGNGPFTLVIIRDNNPIYNQHDTSKGLSRVNINIFDAKEKYRRWTGGGHLIHTTNDIRESRHDLALLLGETYEHLIQELKNNWDGEIKYITQNIVGYDGWDDLNHLLIILNETVNYVVLRNFEGFPESYISSEHGDIDILTDKYNEIICVSNAIPVFHSKYRVHHYVNIGEEKVYFDFRFIGDNYYDKKWQFNILKNKLKYKNLFIPANEDHFFSLLYHGLIHKKYITSDYIIKLNELSQTLFQKKIFVNNINKIETLNRKLFGYLKQKSYKMTIPEDFSVYINDHYSDSKKIKSSLIRISYEYYIKCRKHLRFIKFKNTREILINFYSRRVENCKSLFWLISHYYKFKRRLINENYLEKICVFSFFLWHSGSYYFNGLRKTNNQKVFIKTDFFFGLLKNEITISRYLKSKSFKYQFFPKLINETMIAPFDYAVYNYINGVTLDKIALKRFKKNQKYMIYDQLLYIVKELNKNKLIHRDIVPRNILITKNEKNNKIEVYLIDWLFCVSLNKNVQLLELPFEGINKEILKNLGEAYRQGEYLWDDAYSMLQIFLEFKDYGEEVDEYILELTLLIGKLNYCFS